MREREAVRVLPDEAHERRPRRAAGDGSPVRQRTGMRVTSRRDRRSRRPASAGSAGRRSRCRARRCRRRPGCRARPRPARSLDRLRELPADLRLLRVAEVQAVGERERLAAGARDVERGVHDGAPAGRNGSRSPSGGPSSETAMPARAVDPQHRRVESGPPHRPRADEVVVLLEDHVLGSSVHGIDGRGRRRHAARCSSSYRGHASVSSSAGIEPTTSPSTDARSSP